VLRPFLTHIEKLCKTTDKILLAVSGGMDSMVMLHLFLQAGFSVAVAHCNFQLRGEESDEDENFVAAKCKKWGIPFHSIRFDTNNYAIQHGLSIQMAARELRYNWFHQVKEKENADWIATAHHLSDSVETVLLNLTRGTGLDGLVGIAHKNDFVIRPLLFATHKEVANYAAETGVIWREDRSNETDDYQRNFVRHQIIPKLEQINPAFEQSIAKMVERLSGDGAILTQAIEVWKKQFQKNENDKVILAKKGFEPNLDDSYNSALLWRLVRGFGFHFDQYVWVDLATHDGQVEVSVRDDGIGFEPSAQSGSAYGLVGMRFRVEAEGGTMAVMSAPGQGTLIRVTLPGSAEGTA
jgi:tRNA(Ile)-lysidine synthase